MVIAGVPGEDICLDSGGQYLNVCGVIFAVRLPQMHAIGI